MLDGYILRTLVLIILGLVLTNCFIVQQTAAELQLRTVQDSIASVRSLSRKADAVGKGGQYHAQAVSSSGEPTDDLQLLDLVLVASIDGTFHAFNRTTGRRKWSMEAPSASSQNTKSKRHRAINPLVRSEHISLTRPPGSDDDLDAEEIYIVEPQSGVIYVSDPSESATAPLRRLPFTVPQLIELSPYHFRGAEQSMFVGRKETTLIGLDLETGEVTSVYNSDWCDWEAPMGTDTESFDAEEVDVENPEDDSWDDEQTRYVEKRNRKSKTVFVGRTDYHISVILPDSRKVVQNLVFSTYGPNSIDRVRQSVWSQTPDDRYFQPLPDGKVLAFRAGKPDAFEWFIEYPEPIVAVFDVLSHSSSSSPLLLLQPPPSLSRLFPHPNAAQLEQLSKLADNTHVGLVGTSLFAMSGINYPFVGFGNMPRGSGDDDPSTMDVDIPFDYAGPCRSFECFVGLHQSTSSAPGSGIFRLIGGTHTGLGPSLIEGPTDVVEVQLPASTQSEIATSLPPRPTPRAEKADESTWPRASVMFTVLSGLVGACIVGVKVWSTRVLPLKIPDNLTLTDPIAAVQQPLPPDLPMALSNGPTLAEVEVKPTTPSLLQSTVRLDENEPAGESDGEGEGDVGEKKRTRRKRGRGKKGRKDANGGEEVKEVSGDASSEVVPKAEKPESTPSSNGHLSLDKDLPSIPAPPPAAALPSSLTVSNTVLGFGSHGTMVFKGSLQGRAVAVKRLLQDFVTLATREVTLLQESDDHPNVIRYFYKEAKDNFLYIALELCPASLADIVERPYQFQDIAVDFDPKRALAQVTAGLRHLHSLKIVHRDIKPPNILVGLSKKSSGGTGRNNATLRMMISDFGLCKKLDSDQTSFLPTAHSGTAAGTVGWRAPEILRGEVKLDEQTLVDGSSGGLALSNPPSTSGSSSNAIPNTGGNRTRLTKSVDVFALGCLYFYCLSSGDHPYGDRFEREINILKNAKSLGLLERLGEEGVEAIDLINRMLDPEPHARPDTTACLTHPFFWTPTRRLAFLQDASDRFEIMERDPREAGLVSLETGAVGIVGPDWHRRLDKIFVDNLGKFRKYDGKSVQDLLRALRNKKHHYQDIPENVKRHVGSLPDGFLNYFTKRYPQLFLHVYGVIANSSIRDETMFRSYFELVDP